jgi:HAD superfamily hydrolase (TIGR01484 family)
MPRLLLCTDLDRTVLPNGPQPESRGARQQFAALASRPEVTLVYVTGRHREMVEQAIANYCLPRPDFVIGDVGTTVFEVAETGWRLWEAWEAEIAPDWSGMTPADISALLGDIKVLRLQETAKQNVHKLSYYVPLYVDQDTLISSMQQRLDAHGIRASLVWSVDEPAAIGLLDVLPARANKLHAVEFLMRQQGFEVAETVFAGDSGNDLPVLTSAVPAVLVANASEEVREAAVQQAAANGHPDALYIAHGALPGMNGNYSAGVLEGIVHFIPEAHRWLDEWPVAEIN